MTDLGEVLDVVMSIALNDLGAMDSVVSLFAPMDESPFFVADESNEQSRTRTGKPPLKRRFSATKSSITVEKLALLTGLCYL